jgi:hypothetical protein
MQGTRRVTKYNMNHGQMMQTDTQQQATTNYATAWPKMSLYLLLFLMNKVCVIILLDPEQFLCWNVSQLIL